MEETERLGNRPSQLVAAEPEGFQVAQGAQRRRDEPPSVGCCAGTGRAGCAGPRAARGSGRSTGCRSVPIPAGCAGMRVPSGWRRSAGCRAARGIPDCAGLPAPSESAPVSRLSCRKRPRSAERRPSCGRMRPVRPREYRAISTTRGGSPARVTPSHSAMGVSPPQLSGVRARNWVFAASRLAQSMTRPRLASGSATTTPFSQVGGAAWVGPAVAEARPSSSSVARRRARGRVRTDHLRRRGRPGRGG